MNGGRCEYYVYINRNTGEEYRLEELQNKYELGFADSRLWAIIEALYKTETRYQADDGELILED